MTLHTYVKYAPYVVAYLAVTASIYLWKLAAGRWLSPEEFGMLMFILSVLGLAGAAIYSSTNTYIVREAAKRRISEEEAQGLSLVSAIILSCATLALLPLLGDIVIPLALMYPIYALWSGSATYYRGINKKSKVVPPLLTVSAILLLSAALLRVTHSVLVAVLGYAIAYSLPVIYFRVKPKFTALKRWREILPFIPITAGKNAMVNTDSIMLGILLGYTTLAGYRAAVLLTRPMLILADAAIFVFLPAASRAKNVRSVVLKAILPLAILAVAYAIGVMAFGDTLLAAVYAGKYVDFLPVAQILVLFSAAHAVLYLVNQTLVARDMEAVLTKWILVGTGLNILLNAVLIPLFGAIGAALATGISYLVVDIPPFMLLLRLYRKGA